MVKKEYNISIIIPTIHEKVITLESLKHIKNIEIIIVKDKWKNASKARNIGAKISNGKILVFMDDDIAFNQDFFINALKKVHDKKVLWLDPPFICFITRKDFMETNGFDERIKPTMAETVEFKELLLKKGIKIIELDASNIIHYGGKLTKEKYWLNRKNSIYIALKYERNPKRFIKQFRAKDPIRFIWLLSCLIYWLFILLFIRKTFDMKILK
jgi:GT2 family glycosyltransferase